MKFDNKMKSALLFSAAVLLLAGCGGNTKKSDDLASEVAAPTVVLTEQYLPTNSYDKEGVKLPYVAALNPYAEQKGRLKKESVASYIEARRAFKSKEYKKAKSILTQLVELDKSLSGPWVMLGDIEFAEENIESAIQHYQKAFDINNANTNSLLRLARAYREKGEYVTSQNTYANLLAIWKDFPEAHLNLAVLYDLYLNEPLKAQQHMEAYQFLNNGKNKKVAKWLAEIRNRTGVNYSIEAGRPEEPPLSVAGGVEQ